MADKFWETVSGKLADRWAAMAGPALVFWLGGLLGWTYSQGGLDHLSTVTRWMDRQSGVTQLGVILGVLAVVAASALTVDRLGTPVLRLLEGYWPLWMGRLHRRLRARVEKHAADDDKAWQELSRCVLADDPALATAEKVAEFARVDQRRRRRPSNPNRYMPTRIGNILRAAETWPYDKYGLETVVTWPRLWLLLPETSRQELEGARAALDSAVAAVIWGLLFCTFGIWTPLAIPVGLAVSAAAANFWVPTRAEIFGDLVEAAYDLSRLALYEQLRWPPPSNPRQEHGHGERLTSYLWRGSDDIEPTFKSE